MKKRQKTVVRQITDLKSGDRIIAKLIDIKHGEITIKTNDDTIIKAKSSLVPNAHIGDDIIFTVKSNINGKISLKPDNGEDNRDMFDIRL